MYGTLHLQLKDWWKIVSDEEKAWELLAATSNAVKGMSSHGWLCRSAK